MGNLLPELELLKMGEVTVTLYTPETKWIINEKKKVTVALFVPESVHLYLHTLREARKPASVCSDAFHKPPSFKEDLFILL